MSRGAANGLHGIVLEIVYAPGKAPPRLPLVVFVACPKYRGPSYDDECDFEPSGLHAEILGFAGLRAGQPGVVAVQPIGRDFKAGKGNKTPCLRVQLPLDLVRGITIHKSQSKTIGPAQDPEEALLDIGGTELGLGLTYVGFSRFVGPECVRISPFPDKSRFSRIVSPPLLKPRVALSTCAKTAVSGGGRERRRLPTQSTLSCGIARMKRSVCIA